MSPIFFLSDFGDRDVYAGVVEAVIATLAPRARVVHLTHGVPPQDLRHGSFQLFAATPHLPPGAVVLAVVDPGVGSARRAMVVEGERLVWVAPDNGLLEAALTIDRPRRAYELVDPRYRLECVSTTFHGRDVFGPAAAHLALGVAPSALGPPIPLDQLRSLGVAPADASGEVWTFDHYGNAITTIRSPAKPPRSVRIDDRELPYATHYAEVAPGDALALPGSSGLVELSVRDGSARDVLGLATGARVSLVDPG